MQNFQMKFFLKVSINALTKFHRSQSASGIEASSLVTTEQLMKNETQ